MKRISHLLLISLMLAPVTVAAADKGTHIYYTHSPSVVLVLTNEGSGTGSVIHQSGLVLTTWHVVGNYSEVAVALKPSQKDGKITKADLHRARVVLVDEGSDLALLVMASVPAGLRALQIGTLNDVEIGSDAHVIGHPSGISWTYTKGFFSQKYRAYSWMVEDGKRLAADVLAIQTNPIVIGPSSAVFNNEGLLVGITTFMPNSSIYFAIGGDTVRSFLEAGLRKLAEP